MTTKPLAEQLAALHALAAISTAFRHLPGAHLDVGTVFPDRLTISLHDNLADFETWREALGIDPEKVTDRTVQSQMHLKATCSFGGATVELVGYAPALPEKGGAK